MGNPSWESKAVRPVVARAGPGDSRGETQGNSRPDWGGLPCRLPLEPSVSARLPAPPAAATASGAGGVFRVGGSLLGVRCLQGWFFGAGAQGPLTLTLAAACGGVCAREAERRCRLCFLGLGNSVCVVARGMRSHPDRGVQGLPGLTGAAFWDPLREDRGFAHTGLPRLVPTPGAVTRACPHRPGRPRQRWEAQRAGRLHGQLSEDSGLGART